MNERQFRQLLSKYAQGNTTPEEVDLLHQFYDSFQEESLLEPSTFDRWREEKRIHLNIIRDSEQKERQRLEARRQTISRSRAALRIAASVLLVIGLGVGGYVTYQNQPAPEIAWTHKITRKGQKATITLTDGTKVYLNVDSKLSFPEHFAADQRAVTLEGEAFFEVTRDPKRPFTITSGDLTTTVLGTSFNIKAFAGEAQQVTVATGQVKVRSARPGGAPQEVVLNPYQQAFYDGQLSKQPVDIRPLVAWREKVLRFDEVSLAEAAVVLERWFDVSIVLEDERIHACTINGTYVNETLPNILESFEHVLTITYRTEGERRIIITGKGCNS